MKNFAEEVRKRLSESIPDEFEITTVRISDVFLSTQRFFDNNFRGAIITEGTPDLYGYTEASVDGIAYFFKVLLRAINLVADQDSALLCTAQHLCHHHIQVGNTGTNLYHKEDTLLYASGLP